MIKCSHIFKSLFLLSALFLFLCRYGQGGEHLKPQNEDISITLQTVHHAAAPIGDKTCPLSIELLPITSLSPAPFKRTPEDVIGYIHQFLIAQGSHSLFAADRKSRRAGMSVYETMNTKCRHMPWPNEGPSFPSTGTLVQWWNTFIKPQRIPPISQLTPRALYCVNKLLGTLMGLYINIKNGWAFNDIDFPLFEQSYEKLKSCPSLRQDALALTYAGLLHQDLLIITIREEFARRGLATEDHLSNYKYRLATLKRSFVESLNTITQQNNNSRIENGAALYLHFWQFVCNLPPLQLAQFKGPINFSTLKCSLMDVMQDNLLALKRTPNLSCAAKFSDIWDQILTHDAARTSWQLSRAFGAFSINGNHIQAARLAESYIRLVKSIGSRPLPSNYNAAYENYTKAAQSCFKDQQYARASRYFIERLAFVKQHKLNIREDDYLDILKSSLLKSEDSAQRRLETNLKAAMYFEEGLRYFIETKGQVPSHNFYDWGTASYVNMGDLAKKVDCYEHMIKVLKAQGKELESEHYEMLGYAYRDAGNFVKAAEWFEGMLTVLRIRQQRVWGLYLQMTSWAYWNARNFEKAAERYIDTLETIKKNKEYLSTSTYVDVIKALLKIGRDAQAIHYADEALEFSLTDETRNDDCLYKYIMLAHLRVQHFTLQ